MLNNQGRPTQPGEAHGAQRETFTGNRALEIDEALIFDQGGFDRTGVDIDDVDVVERAERDARRVELEAQQPAQRDGGAERPLRGLVDA